MDNIKNIFRLFIIILFFSNLYLLVYKLQLQASNEYLGYFDFDIKVEYIFELIASQILISIIIPKKIKRPTDLIIAEYIILTVWPYSVFFNIHGNIEIIDYISRMLILIFPIMVISIFALWNLNINLKFFQKLTVDKVTKILILISTLSIIFAFINAPNSASFDLIDSYDRRLDGRDIFTKGSLLAYLSVSTVNSFIPFLGYIAINKRNYYLFIFCLLVDVGFYYILGFKSPFVILILTSLYACLNSVKNNLKYFIALKNILLMTFIIFIIELLLIDFSFIAELFHRRFFIVIANVLDYYFSFIFESSAWNPLFGIVYEDGITYYIGLNYFNNVNDNANTSTFIYYLASGGIPLYLAAIVLIALFSSILNSIKNNKNIVMCFSLIFGYLLNEQAAATSMITSGLFMLFLLTLSAKNE